MYCRGACEYIQQPHRAVRTLHLLRKLYNHTGRYALSTATTPGALSLHLLRIRDIRRIKGNPQGAMKCSPGTRLWACGTASTVYQVATRTEIPKEQSLAPQGRCCGRMPEAKLPRVSGCLVIVCCCYPSVIVRFAIKRLWNYHNYTPYASLIKL